MHHWYSIVRMSISQVQQPGRQFGSELSLLDKTEAWLQPAPGLNDAPLSARHVAGLGSVAWGSVDDLGYLHGLLPSFISTSNAAPAAPIPPTPPSSPLLPSTPPPASPIAHPSSLSPRSPMLLDSSKSPKKRTRSLTTPTTHVPCSPPNNLTHASPAEL